MRYLILGVTEARDENGGPLPVGGPRLRALLTALALRAGRPAGVAALVDDVWDGDRPHDAPAALQALVGRLRRALGKEAVPGSPAGYRLNAGPDDVDLYVFERLAHQGAAELGAGDAEAAARTLREALALWRGPVLADLPGAERAHAVRARAHRLTAVRQRIEADFRRGARTGLVPELRELTAAHPYDEPLHAQLVRALRAEGRQADALVAYEAARRALADGLGADPGPELTALHGELLAPAPARPPRPPEGHAGRGWGAPVRVGPGTAAPGRGDPTPGPGRAPEGAGRPGTGGAGTGPRPAPRRLRPDGEAPGGLDPAYPGPAYPGPAYPGPAYPGPAY
ncbi:AfsR/SARP family transcriptional regulator, partial [Streptomyces sp. NRRL WC-3549]|uniref:AfsR/SARP family transcriptional regulator n=1 Tax=Streptomyces sp. NRRL WC-3549 TaxID=1463925 RepID=UPI0004C74AC4